MLNDGKKRAGRGWPMSQGNSNGLPINYRDKPDDRQGQGIGLAPPGGEDQRSLQ